jgi:hypothetical protein
MMRTRATATIVPIRIGPGGLRLFRVVLTGLHGVSSYATSRRAVRFDQR